MWELRLTEAMPGATSVIYTLHTEYREEGKKKKRKKMERALSRFPLFSFLASDLRRWTLWGVQKWESCGFPVITQHKVSPSTEDARKESRTHLDRRANVGFIYDRHASTNRCTHTLKNTSMLSILFPELRERDQRLFSYWLTSFSTTSTESSRYLFTGEAT